MQPRWSRIDSVVVVIKSKDAPQGILLDFACLVILYIQLINFRRLSSRLSITMVL